MCTCFKNKYNHIVFECKFFYGKNFEIVLTSELPPYSNGSIKKVVYNFATKQISYYRNRNSWRTAKISQFKKLTISINTTGYVVFHLLASWVQNYEVDLTHRIKKITRNIFHVDLM